MENFSFCKVFPFEAASRGFRILKPGGRRLAILLCSRRIAFSKVGSTQFLWRCQPFYLPGNTLPKNFIEPPPARPLSIEIFRPLCSFMQIQSAFCLYLQNGLELFNKFCSSDPSFNRSPTYAYIAITCNYIPLTNFFK